MGQVGRCIVALSHAGGSLCSGPVRALGRRSSGRPGMTCERGCSGTGGWSGRATVPSGVYTVSHHSQTANYITRIQ